MIQQIGDKASFEKTLTVYDVYGFAGITGDFNPVHVNEKYSSSTFFKKRIVHGTLLLGYVGTVLGQKLPGEKTILRTIKANYLKPIYLNETIKVEVIIKDIEKNKIRLEFTILNSYNEIATKGEAITSIPK